MANDNYRTDTPKIACNCNCRLALLLYPSVRINVRSRLEATVSQHPLCQLEVAGLRVHEASRRVPETVEPRTAGRSKLVRESPPYEPPS